MDKKGISWVNNMYQKLESLCVEVEENIYEDTVKYVEGQVKTVGACVKKFYTDVVEDLLPPASQDPFSRENEKPKVEMTKDSIDVEHKLPSKEPLVDAPVKKHIDNGSPGKLQRKRSDFFNEYVDNLESIQLKHRPYKTTVPNTSDLKDLSEHSEQHDDNSDVIYGDTNEGALLASAITGSNYEEAEERETSIITVKKHIDNRPIVKKDTIKLVRKRASTGSLVDAPVKKHLDSGSFVKKDTIKVKRKVGASKSVVDAPVKKHLDDRSSHTSPSKLHREWSDYLEMNLSQDKQDKYRPSTLMPKTSDSKDLSESHSDQHDENSEVIRDLTNGGSLLAAATTGSNSKEAKESESYESFSNSSVWPTAYIAGPRLPQELNAVVEAAENCSQRSRMPSSKALSVELDVLAAVDTESPKSKNAETIKTANEEISRTVKSDKLFGDDTGFDDSDNEGDVKQSDNLKLVESCVMVNKNDCFILDNQGKQRSYKKKIRDVFSLRKRPKDKAEHEQLAVWYDEENGKELVSTSTAVSRSVTSDSVEAEWELV